MARAKTLPLAVTAAVAVLAPLASSPAGAEDASKLYGGAGLAVASYDSDHAGIGYGGTAAGWQIYGGLQARELMAVELAIDRLPSIRSGERLGSGVERLRISAEHTSLTLRGMFRLPLEEVLRRRQKITLFATVGVARSLEERSVLELTTARHTTERERDAALALGAGVTFELKRMRWRAYLESVDGDPASLTGIGAAAEFRF